MIISFFKNNSYSVGVDYTLHPDCIFIWNIEDFDPNSQILELQKNGENFEIKILPKIIETPENIKTPPTPIEIGNKIENEVFGGNRHAQLADLTKSQLKTIAVLVPIIGKEKVKEIYAEEIKIAREVSDVRVESGLEAFDLSFLK